MIQVYTSGTTGGPKGVRLTNRNYLTAFKLITASGGLNYKSGETVLAAMPFFHVAGVNIALIAMASGALSAILRDAAPQLILDAISQARINHAFLAPALIQMLMQAPGIGGRRSLQPANADLRRLAHLGGSACTRERALWLRVRPALRHDRDVRRRHVSILCGSRSGEGQAAVMRNGLARSEPQDRRGGRDRGRAWRGRGSGDPVPRGHEGILEQARRDRGCDRRRLDAHR